MPQELIKYKIAVVRIDIYCFNKFIIIYDKITILIRLVFYETRRNKLNFKF